MTFFNKPRERTDIEGRLRHPNEVGTSKKPLSYAA